MVKKLVAIAFLTAAVACQTDLFFGKVEGIGGRVLAPNGRTPAYKAKVTIADLEPNGFTGEAYTTATGEFRFESVPDGQYRVDLSSPNGLFRTVYYSEVEDGHSPGGVEVLMAPVRAGTFVNVPGRYDDAGVVMKDLGYLCRTVGIEDLAQSVNPLAGADVAFVGSGADAEWAENARVVSNLKSFVAAGGRLVVSDQAWPFIEAAWPGKINWGADPAIGSGGQEIAATMSDADLKRCIALSRWRVVYDLGGWALPASTAGTVFVSGDVATAQGPRANAPLLVGFYDGAGFVAFSTFGWRTQYAKGRLAVRVLNYLIADK